MLRAMSRVAAFLSEMSDGDEEQRCLACIVQSPIVNRQEVFPGQKIGEQATVGIQELGCNGGAGECTTAADNRLREVGARAGTE